MTQQVVFLRLCKGIARAKNDGTREKGEPRKEPALSFPGTVISPSAQCPNNSGIAEFAGTIASDSGQKQWRPGEAPRAAIVKLAAFDP